MRALLLSALLFGLAAPAVAGQITSTYTKLNLETDCTFHQSDDQGGAAKCSGLGDYPVHFAEVDLRQIVEFGFITAGDRGWVSFGEWNRINDTIEWRLDGGRPFATVLRWFIENTDDSGSASKAHEGQVLVVSKVGQPGEFEACVVGYVDAKANPDANVIARTVADTLVPQFRCGVDQPVYHGQRGPHSGTPSGG
jgi:hypothetical protein